jgi:two-component system phosphate regulon response regulator OmpR
MPSAAASLSIPADTAAHILIVDDDARIGDLLKRYLGDNGYRVTVSKSAEDARRAASGLSFDLMVLDVMMPGESGLDYLAELRKTSAIPVIMLTARGEAGDRIAGLESGANDYLGKPFEPRELLCASTTSCAPTSKRAAAAPMRSISAASASRCPSENSPKTDRLSAHRARARNTGHAGCPPNATVSRLDLLGDDPNKTDRAIDVQMTRLRRKIEENPAAPAHLQTVRGVGYRLVSD